MRKANEAAWSSIDISLREGHAERPRMPIEIITCPLGKEVNQGGLLRIAEAFMLEKVSFGREADATEDFSGHRGATQWQPWEWKEPAEAVANAKAQGRQLIALTLTPSAVAFDKFGYRFPCSLVVGSEMDGLPEELVNQCEGAVAIPMFGLTTSLNVAVATGIVIQHIASKFSEQSNFQPIRGDSARLLGG